MVKITRERQAVGHRRRVDVLGNQGRACRALNISVRALLLDRELGIKRPHLLHTPLENLSSSHGRLSGLSWGRAALVSPMEKRGEERDGEVSALLGHLGRLLIVLFVFLGDQETDVAGGGRVAGASTRASGGRGHACGRGNR